MTGLMHYAPRLVRFDRDRRYTQPGPGTFEKPKGLWVSVTGPDDWPEYCLPEFNGMRPEARLRHAHNVTLAPGANVLRLDDVADMLEFHRTYAGPSDFDLRYHPNERDLWGIDWRVVAAEYAGIVIAPYQWSMRLNASWYYTWDCASGCVWDLDAIAAVEPCWLPALPAGVPA
ncbi:hypothetical protein KNU09_gp71 [Gordonia phage TillyBobJoe]|uniref:Uncharacterized protein n=1 Tax=Gordonia phage TillyBobJoe TaxID=2301560 RepID=A0A385DUH8_9CAUD|nr:hypothetical protein KNU09_gp71 [Gordonia phage TillyBobJoe]AXQ62302.1 hypothetical protein SEA_TILLYBOBJOE_71 [Gordonia phage TillyBobJoe]